jgi:cyanate permease
MSDWLYASLEHENYTHRNFNRSPSPPWLNFITHPAAWALYVNHFAAGWGAYTLMTYLPKYMKERLGFDMASAGFLAGEWAMTCF